MPGRGIAKDTIVRMALATYGGESVDKPTYVQVPCKLTGKAEWYAPDHEGAIRRMHRAEVLLGEETFWIRPEDLFDGDEPFRATDYAWMGAPKGWESSTNTITAWTTIAQGERLNGWSEDTYLWTDRESAVDNALDGGHQLVKLTLKVMVAEVEVLR